MGLFCIVILVVIIVIIVLIVIIVIIVMTTGVINCPLVGLCYTAVRGLGAFCNGKKLKTSGCNQLSKVSFAVFNSLNLVLTCPGSPKPITYPTHVVGGWL